MNYMIIDLETTVRNKIGTNKGSAHCKQNKVVLFGCKQQSKPFQIVRVIDSTRTDNGFPASHYADTDLLIGHNIKFDLLYLLRDKGFKAQVWPQLLIWDTALAEYLLTGQDSRFPSLDECSAKYGGTVKDKRISEMWDAGIQTEDIDNDLLTEYLKHDLSNTELVFQNQFGDALEKGMLPLIWSQMLALKATTEMELNGMCVNSHELREQEIHLNAHIAKLEALLVQEVTCISADIPAHCMNFNSNKFVGTVIYGGEVTYEMREPAGKYKTGIKRGQDKFVNNEYTVVFPSQVQGRMPVSKGYNKVDEKTLTTLRKCATIVGQEFIDYLLEYRELSKELNTYVLGIRELIYEDGCVHGNLQHTATVTGRLSSSQPNLQNVTN